MDVSQLWIPMVYFLSLAELVILIMIGMLYATRPYAEGIEADFRYRSRMGGAIITFVAFGLILFLLLAINKVNLEVMNGLY
jgi:hypothetical protein